MKKYMMAVLSALFIIFVLQTVYGGSVNEEAVVARDRSAINLKAVAVTITGKIPFVTGEAYEVNRQIQILVESRLGEAQKAGQKAIDIMFKVVTYEEVYSIILYYKQEGAASYDKADTVVFNNIASPKTPLSLNDSLILGKNGVKLSNMLVNSVIAQEPSKYNASFGGINEKSDFYLLEDKIHFVFDKYEIGPGAAGIQEITLDRTKLKSFEIDGSDYHFGGNYSVRMVPLRAICEAFGYTVSWFPKSVSMENSTIVITRGKARYNLLPGANKYAVNDYLFITLESPPEIIDGVAYVPISYMEEVLCLAIYPSSGGGITFSEYSTN